MHGNIRSVALARLLKKEKFDALACGVIPNKPETLKMLCEWADKVLVVDTPLLEFVPKGYEGKIIDLAIGEDRWHDPLNEDLILTLKRKYYGIKSQLF